MPKRYEEIESFESLVEGWAGEGRDSRANKPTPQGCARSEFNYGSLVAGVDYQILEEGRDYLLVKAGGKSIYAPFHVFAAN